MPPAPRVISRCRAARIIIYPTEMHKNRTAWRFEEKGENWMIKKPTLSIEVLAKDC